MICSPTTSQLIDIHCHIVPQKLPGNPIRETFSRWPSVKQGACGHKTFCVGDRSFRELDDRSWNVERRLQDMDHAGVGVQILSPMPELLSYWLEEKQTITLTDYVNAATATMVASHPGRFGGLGIVTLQNPDRAASEVSELRDRFGLVGVLTGTHVNGVPLGDRKFDVFFESLVESDLCLFVHALHPHSERIRGPSIMEALAGFPCETALCAASFIATDVVTRFPGLRVAFSHGGGAFAMLLPRIQQGWSLSEEMRAIVPTAPIDQAKRLFYDSLVFSAKTLQYLVESFGPSQVMVGTDYPYILQDSSPLQSLLNAGLDESILSKIGYSNAKAFLG